MQFEVGSIVEGKVTSITNFGAFVALPENATGMVHISEVSSTYVREIRDHLTEGQVVKVKIINVAPDGKIALSIKKAAEAPEQRRQPRQPRQAAPVSHRPGDFEWRPTKNASSDFEDMMSKFKATSDEKISDLKRAHDGKYGGFTRSRGNRGNQGL
ncbi:MAG: S1 RNA-binding domain-containing protein [Clostridia bacterium]|nr:S1 RNA-binding domain-containing protein [Clostridia bacterium]